MNRQTVKPGYFESLEERRALGFYRLMKAVVDGCDPFGEDDDERDEPTLMMMEVPAFMRRAHQPLN